MTMKRVLFAALLFAAMPLTAGAQVEKQVEVTKAYVPSVERAAKLAIEPDMTDTTRMRPEIDYSVTPLSLRTEFRLRPIRPATVTYWEFNRPLPFYLKAGAGYPLNSVLDFYVSSQNPGTGYILAFVNHEGRYAKLRNDFDVKNDATRMTNRIGAAAGKYLGRHLLEGELSYENRLYHRYGAYYGPSADFDVPAAPGATADYGDANVTVRLGDEFRDLSRLNFEVALRGGIFFDHSEWKDYGDKARQTALGVSARIARGFGRHRLSFSAGYERLAGQKAVADYREQTIRAGVRYGVEGGFMNFEAGADYCYDKIDGASAGNYILPHLRLDINLGTEGLRPFVEIDGQVHENGYRSLTRQNPYLQPATTVDKSSVDYDGRFGIRGSLWREKFSYRVYAAFSIRDNHIYWYGLGTYDPREERFVEAAAAMLPDMARQTVTSFHGEVEMRPASALRLTLGVHGFIYNNDSSLGDGAPKFRGDLGVRYAGRKISFGVSAAMQGVRKWSLVDRGLLQPEAPDVPYRERFEAPFAFDLRVDFDWKVSGRVGIFAEGRNLANQRLYEYPWYPEYGANFTAGVKLNF